MPIHPLRNAVACAPPTLHLRPSRARLARRAAAGRALVAAYPRGQPRDGAARRGAARNSTERHGTERNGTARHGKARHGTARLGSRAMRGNDGQTRVTEDRAVSSRIHGPATPHRLNSRTGRPRGRRASQLMREASDRDDKVSGSLFHPLSFAVLPWQSLFLGVLRNGVRTFPSPIRTSAFSYRFFSPNEFPRIAVVAVHANSWVGWLGPLDELIAAEDRRCSAIRGAAKHAFAVNCASEAE